MLEFDREKNPLKVVSQEGFEPPTLRLEGACSIQLSYWGIWRSLPDSNQYLKDLQSCDLPFDQGTWSPSCESNTDSRDYKSRALTN